jgi:hypothetical protein
MPIPPPTHKPDPHQVSPSAYEIGFGQLADAEVYHEIAERCRAVTRDQGDLLNGSNWLKGGGAECVEIL